MKPNDRNKAQKVYSLISTPEILNMIQLNKDYVILRGISEAYTPSYELEFTSDGEKYEQAYRDGHLTAFRTTLVRMFFKDKRENKRREHGNRSSVISNRNRQPVKR